MPATFQTEEGILFVAVTGKLSLDDAVEVRAATAEIVNEQSVRKVLGDVRTAEIDVSINEIFRCTAGLAHLFPWDTRHAVVFSPDTFSREDAMFAENVAVNRGVLLKTFTQPDEARQWLLAEESPP